MILERISALANIVICLDYCLYSHVSVRSRMHQFLQLQQAVICSRERYSLRVYFLMIYVALDPLRRVVQSRHLFPLLDHRPCLERQQHLGWSLEPSWLDHKRKHDPRRVRTIRHSRMPEPEVTDDDAPFLRARLYRWGMLSPFFNELWFDSKLQFTLRVCRVLIYATVPVRTDPKLRASIFRSHVVQGNVQRICKRI